MSRVENAIALNPEISKGVHKLYADLKQAMKDNDGALPQGGFSDTFTSQNGLIKISISTVAYDMWAGQTDNDGTPINKGDVGILLDTEMSSGKGPDDVMSKGINMPQVIHTLDDVDKADQITQDYIPVTEFSDTRDRNPDGTVVGNPPLPGAASTGASSTTAGATLEEKAAQYQSKLDPAQAAALVAKQDSAKKLIETLTQYLNAHKNDGKDTTASAITAKDTSSTAATDQSQTAGGKLLAAISVNIDIKA